MSPFSPVQSAVISVGMGVAAYLCTFCFESLLCMLVAYTTGIARTLHKHKAESLFTCVASASRMHLHCEGCPVAWKWGRGNNVLGRMAAWNPKALRVLSGLAKTRRHLQQHGHRKALWDCSTSNLSLRNQTDRLCFVFVFKNGSCHYK